jgi:hypothetical protein
MLDLTAILQTVAAQCAAYPDAPAQQRQCLQTLRQALEPVASILESPQHPEHAATGDKLRHSLGRDPAFDLVIASLLFDLLKLPDDFYTALAAAQRLDLPAAQLFNIFIQLNYLLFVNKAAFTTDAYIAARQGALREFYSRIEPDLGPLLASLPPPTKTSTKTVIIFAHTMNNPRVLAVAWDALELAHSLRHDFGFEPLIVNGNYWLRNSVRPVWPLKSFVGWNGPLQGLWPHRGDLIPYVTLPDPMPTARSLAAFDDAIRRVNPALAIAVGDSNPYADRLARQRPVVTLHFTVDRPLTLYTIPGIHPDLPETAAATSNANLPTIELTPHYSLLGRSQTYPRTLLGLDTDAFVFIVIGHRLHAEITKPFLQLLNEICAAVPAAHILFVGHFDRYGERIAAWPELRLRSHYIGSVTDVRGICEAADVFLNPDRTGGGSSAVYALASGLPVLTLPRGDINFVVGPQNACPDWDEMRDRAITLAIDPTAYAAASTAAHERSQTILGRKAILNTVLQVINQAHG